jgi:serine/threonine-protein kinase
MPLDADGAMRRAAYEVEGLESFAVVTAEVATNRQVDPFDEQRTWIRFAGPPATLRSYSYSDVLRGRVPPAALRNRVVVVGTSAVRLKDASTTSTTSRSLMSGPEVQGNAIATVLAGLPLTSTGAAVDAVLILLLAAFAPLAALRLGVVGVTLTAALAGLAFLGAAQLLFGSGLIIPVVHPVAALLAGLIGVLAVARSRAAAPVPAVPAAPAAPPPPAATMADEIAGLRLEGLIGRGGMGVVYRARQPGLDRVVALKIIDPARAADPGFRERFTREARLAAAIEHPHIVPVHAAGEDAGQLYLVMRYIDGVNLAERLDEGALAPAAVAEIVGQVASALDAAHARGLIHRDVKPANILLVERDDAPPHAFLTDFGITREVDGTAGLTRPGVFVGSVEYAAPEQAAGAGPAADQYSLACVAYECLTGAPPSAREAPGPDLPAEAGEVVLRALAFEPGERWASCTEFAQRLASALLGARAADRRD